MQGVVPEKDQMWSFSIMSVGRFDEDRIGSIRRAPQWGSCVAWAGKTR